MVYRFFCHACQASLSSLNPRLLPVSSTCPFCQSPFCELDEQEVTASDYVFSDRVYEQLLARLFEQSVGQRNRPLSPEALAALREEPCAMDLECTVCQEMMRSGESGIHLHCDHWFHRACLEPWLRVVDTCPCCRQPCK